MMFLRDLLASQNIIVAESVEVSSLHIDSREVDKGGLFFAYPGVASDGRDFILQAIDNGATAVVYEALDFEQPLDLGIAAYPVVGLQARVGLIAAEFYGHPSRELQVFGVTGTNGKTTACTLLAQAFSALGLKVQVMGTTGSGSIGELKKSSQTTANPIEIQAFLRAAVDTQVTQVCMEVSSHALDQGRVNGIEFFCTMFTNLSHDHLDYHGDLGAYAAAKQRLFSDFASELCVINVADPVGAGYVDVASAEFMVTYGQGGDVYVDEQTLSQKGISLVIEANGVELEINSPLVGSVNVPNLEMLVATLLALSTPLEQIQAICEQLEPAAGRMELFKSARGVNVVVDYAHTPDALQKALASVAAHCQGKLVCVFGCGGDRDRAKRPVMGKLAYQVTKDLIITNDNPRSESPEAIAHDIAEGIEGEVNIILDRAEAIRFAIENASQDDWVLVAGKGHETTQEIGNQIFEFSDRQFVRQLLKEAA